MRRFLLVPLLLCALPSFARVVRFDVTARKDAAYPGYEEIRGKMTFDADPANPHNRIIADLDRAERTTFTSDVVILRPRSGGNETLFVDVPNRGGIGSFSDPNDDDYLFRRGYTMAWVAWQFDVRPDEKLLHFDAPVARGIRGKVRADFIVEKPIAENPLAHRIVAGWGKEAIDSIGGTGYAVADPKDKTNVLTERDAVTAPRRVIPRSRWHFTSDRTIALDGGFVPNKIYEVIYTAKDPAVAGTGLAAIRDFTSWAKHDPSSMIPVKYAYGMGISQTGRFLRHFVYEGFNADENGQQVFDGLVVYVAGAGRGLFNQRFAQPSRALLTPVPAFYPADVYPFTDLPTPDPVSGRKEGLLDRAVAEKVVPKIFYMNTAFEYWSRGGSLIHTTVDGSADVDPAPTSRLYVLAGHAHFGGPLPPEPSWGGTQLQNFLNYWALTHALIDAMDAWVKKGTEPPPSRYPKIADGTLVRAEELERPEFPRWNYQPYRVDSATEPPRVLGTYTALVPQVDADGNDLGGIRMPFLTAPLAVHTGWNLRDPQTGFAGDRAPFAGALIPFSKETIAARYKNRDEYLGRFTADLLKLVEEHYVKGEELQYLLPSAAKFWDWLAARP